MGNDWRSKPRTGKSEFMQSAIEIEARLNMGETQKQIYDDLKDKGMTLSYSQFNRYIKSLFGEEKNKPVKNKVRESNIIKPLPNTDESVIDASKNKIDESPNEESIENNISISDWHSINITRQPLIKRLEENGFTPNEVKEWKLSNETQISKKLTELLIKGNK
jgi:hypothetical protein